MARRHSVWVPYGVLALIAACAAGLLAYATRLGLGTTTDSLFYLRTAGMFQQSEGPVDIARVVVHTRHFPPLYSMVLWWFAAFGLDPERAARILHLGLFAVNTFLGGTLVHRLTRSSTAAVAAACLLAVSPSVVRVHLMLLTEPLFIALLLAGVVWLTGWFAGASPRTLYAAALVLGLTAVLRYSGTFVVAGSWLVMWRYARPRLPFWRSPAVWFAAISAAPFAGLSLLELVATGRVGNRDLVWHPAGLHDLWEMADTFGLFVTTDWVPSAVRIVVFAAIVLLVAFFLARHWSEYMASPARSTPLVVAAVYMAGMLVSKCLFDAMIHPEERHLSTAVYLLLPVVCAALLRTADAGKPGRAVVTAGAAAVLLVNVAVGARKATTWADDPVGLSSRIFRDSQVMAFVRTLDPKIELYSNAGDVIEYYTGRAVKPFPATYSAQTRYGNPKVRSQISAICKSTQSGALVVEVDNIQARDYLVTADQLQQSCGLELRHETPDGRVFGTPSGFR